MTSPDPIDRLICRLQRAPNSAADAAFSAMRSARWVSSRARTGCCLAPAPWLRTACAITDVTLGQPFADHDLPDVPSGGRQRGAEAAVIAFGGAFRTGRAATRNAVQLQPAAGHQLARRLDARSASSRSRSHLARVPVSGVLKPTRRYRWPPTRMVSPSTTSNSVACYGLSR